METESLANAIMNIAPHDGDFYTPIPALKLYRRSHVSAPMPCIYGLGLGIAVQGAKRVTLGSEIFDYSDSQSLVTSIDVPVVAHVTKASVDKPYIGAWLDLDARLISQLVSDAEFTREFKQARARALSVVDLDRRLLDALSRLIQLLDEPALLAKLAPLIQQEITLRLLYGEHGHILRHLVTVGSPSQQIAKIISWLKLNFTKDVLMDDLAAKAHMSASTFRQHFRSVAGMSPLQYIKNLRLQEARQLMMNDSLDASSAAVRVGYESASQFSREYTRLFGAPPLRDIKNIRVRI
jgi:AraC-like DNA-binding protein